MIEKETAGYVAGKHIQGKFMPMVLIINFGWYEIKSKIELYEDNYGHLTIKPNKFFKNKSTIKEGKVTDVSNLLQELRDIGLEIVEIHSGTLAENAYDITPSSDFPAPL
jgi:hypothetical protein